MKLDRLDQEILTILQTDGRISNQALAKQVGLSPAPCWRRVKRLQDSGLIRGYVALVEPAKVGLNLIGYVQISLDDHHPDTVDEFDRVIAGLPEVQEFCSLSGQYDYMLRVVVPSMAAFEDLLNHHLLRLRGVRNCNTSFVLKQKKWTTAVPLGLMGSE